MAGHLFGGFPVAIAYDAGRKEADMPKLRVRREQALARKLPLSKGNNVKALGAARLLISRAISLTRDAHQFMLYYGLLGNDPKTAPQIARDFGTSVQEVRSNIRYIEKILKHPQFWE